MPTTPSVHTVGTAATGSGTMALTVPTCSDGDTLLAFIGDFPQDSIGYAADPSSSGWSVVKVAKLAATDARLTVLSRPALAADTGTTVTFANIAFAGAEGVIIAYQGAAGVDVSQGATGVATSAAAAPAVTTTRTNARVVDAWTFAPNAAQTLTVPATSRLNVAGTTSHMALAVSDQTKTTPGTTTAQTCTTSDALPSVRWAAVTLALYPNQTPNAPTVTTPTSGSTIDRNGSQRFTAPFSDPDAGDSQSALDIRYSSDGGTTWTTVSRTGPNNYIDLAAGTLAAGSYQVQGRSHDSVGNISPWGSSTFFTAADPPVGPTITDPTSGATLAAATYAVTFSYPTLTQYQWRVLGDLAGVADPTSVINAGATVSDAASRSFTVTGLPNTTTVHIQVRVLDGGLWSSWADSSNPVAFGPPPVPTLAITTYPVSAAIGLSVTTAAPGTGQTAAVYCDIYRSTDGGTTSTRVATGLPTTGVWTDYTPASGVDYTYQVVTVATSGATSATAWTGAAVEANTGIYGAGYGSVDQSLGFGY